MKHSSTHSAPIPGVDEQQKTTRTHSTLAPYVGSWGRDEASHLLRRCMFGPTESEIQWASQGSLNLVINELLTSASMPNPPLNAFSTDDPEIPLGATWINASSYDGTLNFYRRRSLVAWNIGLMLKQNISLREKMTLFWHNHFALEMNVVNDARFIYRYNNLLRTHALGNFKTLVEEITIDPAMLRYLNGNQNLASSPNENYARELLELFSIGKGPLIGPGNYTNYTEDDVRAASKVLTGWRDRGYTGSSDPIHAEFRANKHDTDSKQFSSAYNNAVLTDNGANEYKDLVAMIFNQAETARYICRKLYRWFVYYEIDATIEQNIIEPMALSLVSQNFDVAVPLQTLLASEHFFDPINRGCLIKNPIDFTVGVMRQFEVSFPDEFNLEAQYIHYNELAEYAESQLMSLFNPPNVAGWPAYYQVPSFHEAWISSVTLPARTKTHRKYNLDGGYNSAGFRTLIEPLGFLDIVSDPLNPNTLITEFAQLLYPQPLDQGQFAFLKEVLIPGLPDFEWTLEYSDFLTYPNDPELRASVTNKLRALLDAMMSLAEFHLS